jgi:hypothetical protein
VRRGRHERKKRLLGPGRALAVPCRDVLVAPDGRSGAIGVCRWATEALLDVKLVCLGIETTFGAFVFSPSDLLVLGVLLAGDSGSSGRVCLTSQSFVHLGLLDPRKCFVPRRQTFAPTQRYH